MLLPIFGLLFFLVKGRIVGTWNDNKGRKEVRGIRNRNWGHEHKVP